MAEDEPDIRIPAHDPVADEEVGGAGGVEEEVGGERRDAVDGGRGKLGRVDEHHGTVLVEDPPQRVLAVRAQIRALVVGEQRDPVGPQFEQGTLGLLGGRVDVRHGQRGEPAEAAGVLGGEGGGEAVQPPGQVGRLGLVGEESGAGGGDGEERRFGAQQVHRFQGRLGNPVGQGAATGVGDTGPGEGVAVEGRHEVLMDVDPAGGGGHGGVLPLGFRGSGSGWGRLGAWLGGPPRSAWLGGPLRSAWLGGPLRSAWPVDHAWDMGPGRDCPSTRRTRAGPRRSPAIAADLDRARRRRRTRTPGAPGHAGRAGYIGQALDRRPTGAGRPPVRNWGPPPSRRARPQDGLAAQG
ncbi:hypothetical protein STRIP9103_08015 [Streptomyces ipomoeae 91-03]|uniref:Uncharacterized protein n=1 Tax=Streptomyces ipomoeae 91-03 TaxID=698759 RepID=L1KI20_9ACTN|nr:hypothetical protein STRIP9103_08015 [Streptomyces ipomoeae 91-03]